MKNKDLNKLAKEVHENAVKNGFWDDNPSTKHCLMMVVTELSEAVEADRKGNRADMDAFGAEKADKDDCVGFDIAFGWYIKDTVEDELADAYLRLLDLAGKKKIYFDPLFFCNYVPASFKNFTENIYDIVEDLTNSDNDARTKIMKAKNKVEGLAKSLDIDLMRHVELKMKYNQTREYKHGKRY